MSVLGSVDQPLEDYLTADCPSCSAEFALARHMLDDVLSAFVPMAEGQVVVTCTVCGGVFRALRKVLA